MNNSKVGASGESWRPCTGRLKRVLSFRQVFEDVYEGNLVIRITLDIIIERDDVLRNTVVKRAGNEQGNFFSTF